MVDLYGFHVGKYTVRPMDPMGTITYHKPMVFYTLKTMKTWKLDASVWWSQNHESPASQLVAEGDIMRFPQVGAGRILAKWKYSPEI